MPCVRLRGLDGQVAEVAVPADPLALAELVALLADGQEIIGEQRAEPVGVAAQLSFVEDPPEPKNVACSAGLRLTSPS